MNTPDFLLVPFELIRNKNLRYIDQLVYGAIYWMVNLKGERCYASNKTFADMFDISTRNIRGCLQRLEKEGYIERVFDEHQAKRMFREQIIPLVRFRGVGTNVPRGVGTNVPQSYKSPKNKNNNIKKLEKLTHLKATYAICG